MIRIVGCVIALLVFAPSTFAACVECPVGSCSYTKPNGTIVVTEGPSCGSEPASGHGFNNCRDVGSCRGCAGWTCITRDPQGFAAADSEVAPAEDAIEVVILYPIEAGAETR